MPNLNEGKMKEDEIEPYCQKEAKQIVDTLFDGGLFKEGVTRDNMSSIENLIAYLFQSHARTARKCSEIMLRLKKDV